MNWRDKEWLLGRHFVADVLVLAIARDPERTVTLRLNSGRATLSYEQLMTLIEHNFLVESDGGETHGHS